MEPGLAWGKEAGEGGLKHLWAHVGATTKGNKGVSWSHCPGELWGLAPTMGTEGSEPLVESEGSGG